MPKPETEGWTVLVSCGCTVRGVETAASAFCPEHPDAVPVIRQRGERFETRGEEGGWVRLGQVAEELTAAAERLHGAMDGASEELRDFTRRWVERMLEADAPAVVTGRFETLEPDDER